ncbi:MAG: hypothetical protein WA549_01040 [Thermoplasmata archaeon]
MPGAPNRPPDPTPESPPKVAAADTPQQKALRRIAPARVALLLDLWKGSPPFDIVVPFEKAEAAYVAGDFPGALNALDQLAIRFAEPRWPTMPMPFRELRVTIPAPMPPQWDPEFSLSPEERESRRRRRFADTQLALAEGVIAWAQAKGIDLGESVQQVAIAKETLAATGADEAFFAHLDAVWTLVRDRVPAPKAAPPRAPAARPAPASEPEEA